MALAQFPPSLLLGADEATSPAVCRPNRDGRCRHHLGGSAARRKCGLCSKQHQQELWAGLMHLLTSLTFEMSWTRAPRHARSILRCGTGPLAHYSPVFHFCGPGQIRRPESPSATEPTARGGRLRPTVPCSGLRPIVEASQAYGVRQLKCLFLGRANRGRNRGI